MKFRTSFLIPLLLLAADARAAGNGNLNFFGLDHTAVGQAVLSVDQQTGRLKISNLGSSGCDGVSIDLGDTDGWMAVGQELAGSDWALEYIGTGSGPNTQSMPMLGARITDVAGTKTLEVGFEGVPSVSITAFRGEDLVYHTTGHTGGGDYIYLPIAEYVLHHTCINTYQIEAWPGGPKFWVVEFTWIPAAPPNFTFGDGVQAQADRLLVTQESPSIDFDSLESMELRATSTPDIEIDTESVRLFDVVHTALDAVRLEPSGSRLKISNLGSSGCDGVSISTGDTEQVEADFQELDPGDTAPSGAFFEAGAIGSVDGVRDHPLGKCRVTKVASNAHMITADYTELGSQTHIIQVYSGGMQVVEITGHSGPVARVDAFPAGCGKLNGKKPCVVWCWPTILNIDIDGIVYMGDELRVLAETQSTVDFQQHLELRAADLGEFTLTGVRRDVVPPITTYCTAKSGLQCGPPSIAASGEPHAAGTSGFTVSAAPARGLKAGILLYSENGRAAIPFDNGLLCVGPPFKRAQPTSSGGTAGQCDGVFSIDMNAFGQGLLGGNPAGFLLVPGTQVNVQWWGRDSVATGSFLSDGAEYQILP